MSITLVIIIITVIISYTAFSNHKIIDDLIFYPPAVTQQKQWYRFFTCGVIHADMPHLFFNMFSLYIFGDMVEERFQDIFGDKGKLLFLFLYVTALAVCLIPTFEKHKDDYNYRSLGASGAVSAIVFAGLFLFPTQGVGIFPIPFYIPAFIFGPLYIIISYYMDKRKVGNINHSAHIWGALYGVAFLIIVGQLMSDHALLQEFIDKVQNYIRNKF